MKEKKNMFDKVKCICSAVLMAGVLLLLIGGYLCMVKAGIPYQDPTIEMTIQWSAYNMAGEYNLKCGTVMMLIGIIGMISAHIWQKKSK